MMLRVAVYAALLAHVSWLPACGGGTSGRTQVDATSTSDSVAADTSSPETGTDVAVTETSQPPEDVAPETSAPDVVEDTAVAETAEDTAVAETAEDTAVAETAEDTSVAPDTVASGCDETPFEPGSGWISEDERGVFVQLVDEQGDLDDVMAIELLDGAFAGPGTYQFGLGPGEDNYGTCKVCLVMGTGCGANGCSRFFFATSGRVVLTSVDVAGQVAVGRLADVELEEVTLDPVSSTSTPVPDGDTRCLDTMEFEVAPACDGHEDCADPATPFCHPTALTCQACLTDFDCSASAPACNTLDGYALQCMSVDRCFADDAREPKDDGLGGATAVTFGQTYAGRLCGSDDTQPLQPIEFDWYTFELAEESDVWFDVEVPAEFYLDSLYLSFVTGGEAIGNLGPFTNGTTQRGATLPAGTWFVGARWMTSIEDVLLHYELKIYLD